MREGEDEGENPDWDQGLVLKIKFEGKISILLT